ncbi:MAG: hypothetical protein K8S87_09950 [Planctomycetes bacterium]|nr:hypothetical protein [Planctomycetota bacterium]
MSRKVRKYTQSEIFQHWLLVSLFTLLAITGFVQAKPMGEFSKFFIGIFGTLSNVISIHRILGNFYILYFLVHFVFIIVHLFKGNRGLLITKSDILKPFEEKVSRFRLRHKLDYYAVIFGSFVFIVTGLCLMFPEFAASVIGGSGISVIREIHFNEAVIATGVIIFWHLFYAHCHPEVFPVSTQIFLPKKK